MTVFIPTWLLWSLGLVIGVPALVVVLASAIFGMMVANSMRGGIWK